MSKLASKILRQNSAITTISPFSNNQIIFGTDAGKLNIYDLQEEKYLWTKETIGRPLTVIPFSEDKEIFSLEGPGYLVIRDSNNGQCMRMIGHTDSLPVTIAIFPDGKKAISTGWDKKIKIWDLYPEEYTLDSNGDFDIMAMPCIQILEGHSKTVSDVNIFSSQKEIISGSWDGTLKIWDLETGKCNSTLEDKEDWSIIGNISLFSNETKVICDSDNGTLKIWDLKNRELLSVLRGHKELINKVAIFSDGKKAVSASDDKTLKIWDLETNQCISTLNDTSKVKAFTILPGDKQIVSGSSNGEIFLWDI